MVSLKLVQTWNLINSTAAPKKKKSLNKIKGKVVWAWAWCQKHLRFLLVVSIYFWLRLSLRLWACNVHRRDACFHLQSATKSHWAMMSVGYEWFSWSLLWHHSGGWSGLAVPALLDSTQQCSAALKNAALVFQTEYSQCLYVQIRGCFWKNRFWLLHLPAAFSRGDNSHRLVKGVVVSDELILKLALKQILPNK